MLILFKLLSFNSVIPFVIRKKGLFNEEFVKKILLYNTTENTFS